MEYFIVYIQSVIFWQLGISLIMFSCLKIDFKSLDNKECWIMLNKALDFWVMDKVLLGLQVIPSDPDNILRSRSSHRLVSAFLGNYGQVVVWDYFTYYTDSCQLK